MNLRDGVDAVTRKILAMEWNTSRPARSQPLYSLVFVSEA